VFILLVTYIPPLQPIFNSGPFAGWIWGFILCAPLAVFAIEELRKLLVRKGVQWLSV